MKSDKLRRKLDQQTARDHTHMRNWRERRYQRVTKVMDEPVLPRFCTICFVCMLAASIAMSSYDIYAHATFLSDLGVSHMLQNAVASAFWGWLFFAAPLIPCAAFQLHRGFDDPYFERFLLTRRGKKRMPIRMRFRLYLWIAAVGLILLFIAYLITRAAA